MNDFLQKRNDARDQRCLFDTISAQVDYFLKPIGDFLKLSRVYDHPMTAENRVLPSCVSLDFRVLIICK